MQVYNVKCWWASVDTYPSGFNVFSVVIQHLANEPYNIDSTHIATF